MHLMLKSIISYRVTIIINQSIFVFALNVVHCWIWWLQNTGRINVHGGGDSFVQQPL